MQILKSKETEKITKKWEEEILPEMMKMQPNIEKNLDLENSLSDDFSEDKNPDWEKVFEEYQVLRKPDGDAVQDLSVHNYYVMRDFVGDPQFLLQKKFERRIQELYPDHYMPLYSQVTFSNIRYSEAWKKGMEQDVYMKDLMKQHDIETMMNEGKVDDLIHSIFKDKKVLS